MIPEKPPLDFLLHYGKKGMKWGKRKAAAPTSPMSPRYKPRQQAYDLRRYGPKGVGRINDRISGGMNVHKARRREFGRNFLKTSAIAVGVAIAPGILSTAGSSLASSVVTRAAAKRGQAAAAKMFGLATSNIIKSTAKRGVYNITTMR